MSKYTKEKSKIRYGKRIIIEDPAVPDHFAVRKIGSQDGFEYVRADKIEDVYTKIDRGEL